MRLGSTVSLQGKGGAHLMLDGNPCNGREFKIVVVGTGLPDTVRCQACNLEFSIYGDSILDPLTEAFLDLSDETTAFAAVKITCRFSHGNANGSIEIPTKWFKSVPRAHELYAAITKEAAFSAWPKSRYDSTDTLNSISVELLRKGIADWEGVDRKEYDVRAGSPALNQPQK